MMHWCFGPVLCAWSWVTSATLVSRGDGIPLERLTVSTYPNRRGIPLLIMENFVAVRKRELTVMFPNAAGSDVGSASLDVAVPPEREQPVREVQSFTAELAALADWLSECGIDTVVMESTGVYWIPLYELLEGRGFKVYLVNARHIKNVSGKKSDVLDCQWLQQLMSYGLLAGAFRPSGEVCALRAGVRPRDSLIKAQAQQEQRKQKEATTTNVQMAN